MTSSSGLAVELLALRDRTLGALDAAHDYYSDTKVAWMIVQEYVNAGHRFTLRKMATGTVTTQDELVAKSRGYVDEQLREATFQQFLSIFEAFLFDFLRSWLSTYPQGLFKRMIDFESAWNAPDKDAIMRLVIDKELNEVLYDRPSGWFDYLEGRAKLGCPAADEVGRIAEAKATRDILAHNRGVANKTYLAKAGALARSSPGERIDVPEDYHRSTWTLIRKVVADVSDSAIAKVV
jgi:hypothetical protein